MSRAAPLALLALLVGCAAQPQGPSVADTGMIIGEVSDARNRARVHTELAAAYFDAGNRAVALEELRRATAIDPSYALAHSLLGRVYMELKEHRLADRSFARALELSPDDPGINHSYGVFLCQTGKEEASVRYFLRAVGNPLYAAPWRSYSAAGLCSLRADNVKQADEFFQRALRLEPDEPTSLLKLAGIRYRQGRYEEARRLITRYNKMMEPNAESLWLGVRVERRVGDRVTERAYAEQLRRRFPGSPEYRALERSSR